MSDRVSPSDFLRIYERCVLLELDPIARLIARDTLARHARDTPTLATSDPANRIPGSVVPALDQSLRLASGWRQSKVAESLRAMEEYAWNLVDCPWKKEFRSISAFSGFFKTHIELNLSIPAYIILFSLIGYVLDDATGYLRLSGHPDRTKIVIAAFDFFRASVEMDAQQDIMELVGLASVTPTEVYICRLRFAGSPDACAEFLLMRSSTATTTGTTLSLRAERDSEGNKETQSVLVDDIIEKVNSQTDDAVRLYREEENSRHRASIKEDASRHRLVTLTATQQSENSEICVLAPLDNPSSLILNSKVLKDRPAVAPLPFQSCRAEIASATVQGISDHMEEICVDSDAEHVNETAWQQNRNVPAFTRDMPGVIEAQFNQKLDEFEAFGRQERSKQPLISRGLKDEGTQVVGTPRAEGVFRRSCDTVTGHVAPLTQQTRGGLDGSASSREKGAVLQPIRNVQDTFNELQISEALTRCPVTRSTPHEVDLYGNSHRGDLPGRSSAGLTARSSTELAARSSRAGTQLPARSSSTSTEQPEKSSVELAGKSHTEPISRSRNALQEASRQQVSRTSVESQSEAVFVGAANLETMRIDPVQPEGRVERISVQKPESHLTARQQRRSGEGTGLDVQSGRIAEKGELKAFEGMESVGGQRISKGLVDAERKQRGRGERKLDVWQCRLCTFANGLEREICDMCGTARFEQKF